jgi:signal transduction histidine kinase
MAKTVAEDLHKKEKNLDELIDDADLVKRLFAEAPSDRDINLITQLPFYIYGYDKGAIVFWNSNEFLADCNNSHLEIKLEKNDRGSFIKKCIRPSYLDSTKHITVLIPIVHRYPFENNYLKSHFEAESYIPVTTEVLERKTQGSFEIKNFEGKPLFYLSFAEEKATWTPGKMMMWLISLALLSTIIWLQLITIYLTRKRNPWLGFAITIGAIVAVRAATYVLGLPFNLRDLPIFSPQLYASSSFLPSLGDLLLNTFCLLWAIIFTLRHVPYNIFQNLKLGKAPRIVLAILISFLLIWYAAAYINIVRSLVIDSNISFDVSHFYSITSYTLIGLLTIGLITGVSCLVFYLFNVQLVTLTGNKLLKNGIVVAVGLVAIYFTNENNARALPYYLLACLMAFMILLDFKKLTDISDLFSPQMIFWSFMVCAFCTATLLYFYNIKERETRKRYAEQVVRQRDDVTEFAFKNISQNIQRDGVIKQFFESPTAERRRSINERFDALYLGGQLNKYQSKILIFDNEERNLFNNDTISFKSLNQEALQAEFTSDSTLYYKEFAQDGDYYFARIPIYDDSLKQKLGTIFIDLSIKESGGETVYPELLQPGNIKNGQNDVNYAYGVYVNNKLLTQSGDYSFPVYLGDDNIEGEHIFTKWDGSSELRYEADATKTVIVIRFYKLWLDSITLFSYLFGIQIIIVLFIVIYRLCLSYFTRPKSYSKLINLTLKKRIHFSMLGIVLISFFVIGVVTILYFTLQYKQSNRKKMSRTIQIVERSTLQFLKLENGLANAEHFNAATKTTKFKYFITALATAQKIDINVFGGSGILNVASQESIYDKILLARIIRPDAYFMLTRNSQVVIQNETIGRLTYLSCYVPIRDNEGRQLGYINVPFFASEKELNFQISNILVALINLYAFIFLLSTVLTVFITRWLTKTLSVVINRFERLSLTKNEPIDWPYEDEIGTLVAEYNKMVKKVEENAVLLAQSERESAWREMARQVAHEIKNPLTPMKLNIQYLQQAIKNGYPNVSELALKVTESMIEQIDNLSYIASEFSNFAKMPEAKPEDVDLNELLDKAVELYLNEENIKVSLKKSAERLVVHADKSQLLRVFTNLLENAVQAVPEGRTGLIAVQLNKDDGYVLISFADNGAGIPEDVVEKIFQPYFTTKSSGTGLGLAMTKKIIEFWKGRIWFETEPGKGTTFFIRLPLV